MGMAEGKKLRRRLGASLTITALAVVSAAAVAGPQLTGPVTLSGPPTGTRIHVMVQLQREPTVKTYKKVVNQQGPNAHIQASTAAVSHLSAVRQEQASFAQAVSAAGLSTAKEIYRLQRTYNGVMMTVDASELADLAALPGVKAVYPVQPKRLLNAHSMPFLGVPAVWDNLGLDGTGVSVGIIDTGIDYEHVNFGGDGDYSDNTDSTVIEAGTFPTTRVVGGWDFAGADYDPDDPDNEVPVPDPDPMDFHGHGSHVAGTVGGNGVTTAGETYTGDYDDTIDMSGLSIGPGAAPGVDLYALKVFSDAAAPSALADLAVEWAVDPNDDGDFSDHLDVLNLSLGGLYGSSNNPESEIYANAVQAGVIVVAAAGNEYDLNFISANPGAIPEVISVAASVDDGMEYQSLSVLAPTAAAADYPVVPAEPGFGPPLDATGVTGDLAFSVADPDTESTTACVPLTVDLTGKIAVVDRGECTFTEKVVNAQDVGAVGVVVVNNVPGPAGVMAYTEIGTPVTIPSVMLRLSDGNTIKTAMASDTLNAKLHSGLVTAPDEADTIAGFSSRGPTRTMGQVRLKPDVTAPGVDIFSTAAQTGTDGAPMAGTSMATPHVAGLMALMRENQPTWTVQQLKAALMNTATPNVYGYAPLNNPVSPARSGAGRVMLAEAAEASVIAYDADAPESVSVSFHTLDVIADTSETRTIRLENASSTAVTYDVTYVPAVAPPGVTVNVPATAAVPASGTLDLTISLDVTFADLERLHDDTISAPGRFWLSEASGYVVFTPQGGGATVSVPAYAAIRPASDMSAVDSVDTSGAVNGAGSATITLEGTGVEAGAAPPYGVDSLVWPFELSYRDEDDPPPFAADPELPPTYDLTETNFLEIKSVGVNSTVAMGDDLSGAMLFFGIENWGPWGSFHEVIFDLYIKNASAPDWQYNAWYIEPTGLDFSSPWAWSDNALLCIYDLVNNGFVGCYGDALNYFGAGVHTPAFLSDAMVMFFPAGLLGLSPGDSAIEFQVVVSSSPVGWGMPFDATPQLRYDLAAPAVAFPDGFALPDLPTTEINVDYDMNAALANNSGGVFLLHHHNANGARGEVVAVDGMTCTTDADCPPILELRDCDELTGACVGCVDESACLPGQECDDFMRQCVTDCTLPEANPCAPGAYCDIVSTECVDDCRQATAEPCLEGSYCHPTTGQCQVANSLTVTTDEPKGTNCPNGGLRIDTGLDMNGDGVLDQDEILVTEYVCNALETLVETTDEPMGANCEWGGQRIDSGVDDNGDGVLQPSEIDETSYACNGPDGYETLTVVTEEEPGDNCPSGGQRIDTGVDEDRDGELDDEEISETSYVCNALVSITESKEVEPGAACEMGGMIVLSGRDANGNGELDHNEIESHYIICNNGTVKHVTESGGACSIDSGNRQDSRAGFAALLLLGLAAVRRRRKAA